MRAALGMLNSYYKPISKQVGKKVIIMYDVINESKDAVTYAFQGILLARYLDRVEEGLHANLRIRFEPEGHTEILIFEKNPALMDRRLTNYALLRYIFDSKGREVFRNEEYVKLLSSSVDLKKLRKNLHKPLLQETDESFIHKMNKKEKEERNKRHAASDYF